LYVQIPIIRATQKLKCVYKIEMKQCAVIRHILENTREVCSITTCGALSTLFQ